MSDQNLCFLFGKEHPAMQEQSFSVFPGQHSIRITIDISFEPGLYTVLYVYAPSHCLRAMRQIGYGERVLQISEENAQCSYGACAGPLSAGTWTIRAVIYGELKQYFTEDVPLSLTVSDTAGELAEPAGEERWMNQEGRILFPEDSPVHRASGWYAGDFHVHTHLSDGQETMRVQMWKADLMDLSFFMVTEHNLMPFSFIRGNVLAIPSIEITASEGHCNLFGLQSCMNDPDRFCWDSEHADELLNEAIREAHRQNALVSVNHPFLSPWAWQDADLPVSELDCLEVINDPTYPGNREANRNAIALLDA
ncbi:MAG: CehA/McbA family metallohydrolase, partial [Bulleidia sp.]